MYFVHFVFCKLFTILRQKHGVVRKYPLLYSRFVNKTQKNVEYIVVNMCISWYNNSVKKRGEIQKDIKKDDSLCCQLILSSKKAYIYNIEENGGKPQ